MLLTISPLTLCVPASGGVSKHELKNNGDTRLTFKVKSTNNDQYRLKPVYGFVEPGQKTPLEVTRTEGPIKKDKLVIQFAEAFADASDAQALWKGRIIVMGDLTLPMSAVDSDFDSSTALTLNASIAPTTSIPSTAPTPNTLASDASASKTASAPADLAYNC